MLFKVRSPFSTGLECEPDLSFCVQQRGNHLCYMLRSRNIYANTSSKRPTSQRFSCSHLLYMSTASTCLSNLPSTRSYIIHEVLCSPLGSCKCQKEDPTKRPRFERNARVGDLPPSKMSGSLIIFGRTAPGNPTEKYFIHKYNCYGEPGKHPLHLFKAKWTDERKAQGLGPLGWNHECLGIRIAHISRLSHVQHPCSSC